MIKGFLPCVGAMALLVGASQAWAEDVPTGVYDCYGRLAANGYHPDDDRKGAQSTQGVRSPLATGASTSASKFSVTGPGRYLSRGGSSGRFSFDGLTLSMVDGPYAGLKYHKATPAWTFRELNPSGPESAVMCPRSTSKDIKNPNAW